MFGHRAPGGGGNGRLVSRELGKKRTQKDESRGRHLLSPTSSLVVFFPWHMGRHDPPSLPALPYSAARWLSMWCGVGESSWTQVLAGLCLDMSSPSSGPWTEMQRMLGHPGKGLQVLLDRAVWLEKGCCSHPYLSKETLLNLLLAMLEGEQRGEQLSQEGPTWFRFQGSQS